MTNYEYLGDYNPESFDDDSNEWISMLSKEELEMLRKKANAYVPRLSSYNLANFKVFGKEQTVPIKPITLIFGPNSAGKSSLFQSLLMLKQTLSEAKDPNLALLTKGKHVDLGSYKNLLHRNDLSKSFSVVLGVKVPENIDIEIANHFHSGDGEPWPFGKYCVDCQLMDYDQIYLKSTFSANPEKTFPYLSNFEFFLDDLNSPVFSRKYFPSVKRKCKDFLNRRHPYFKTLWQHGDCCEPADKFVSYRLVAAYQEHPMFCVKPTVFEKKTKQDFVSFVKPRLQKALNQMQAEIKAKDTEADENEDWIYDRNTVFSHPFLYKKYSELYKKYHDDFFLKKGFDCSLLARKDSLSDEEYVQLDEIGQQFHKTAPKKEILLHAIDQFLKSLRGKVSADNLSEMIIGFEDVEEDLFNAYMDAYEEQKGGFPNPYTMCRKNFLLTYAYEKDFESYRDDYDDKLAISILATAQHVTKIIQGLKHIGPIREVPERFQSITDQSAPSVGRTGENTAAILFQSPDLLKSINQQINLLLPGFELKAEKLSTDDKAVDNIFMLRLLDTSTGQSSSICDVGFGISQLLPVIVESMLAYRQTILIEQPELHLHPALQAEIGDLFIEAALGEKENTFLLETHSEHLILRIMRRMRETAQGRLPEGLPPVRPEDVSVLYVEPTEDGSVIRSLELNEEGEFLDPWPGGFFEESFEERFA